MNASTELYKDTLNTSGFSGSAFADDNFSLNGDGSGNNSFHLEDNDEAEGDIGVDFFASFAQPSNEDNMLF